MPKISVIMPVYNTKEKYFREAIESILGQSFDDYELIIVDDCSKSYIHDIVNSYTDKHIKYYRLNKNAGAANARNVAIKKAKGKYLAFMDSDDISLKERLALQYEFFEKHPEIDFIGTSFEQLKNNNKKQISSYPLEHEAIVEYLLCNGCAFCQSTVMLKKNLLKKYHVEYKTQYTPAEDYAFFLNLIGKAKFAIMDKMLVQYRFYSDNISHKQKDIQYRKASQAQVKALENYFKQKFPLSVSEFFMQKDCDKKHFLDFEKYVIEKSMDVSYPKPLIEKYLKRQFKQKYRRTHSFFLQCRFLCSPLNQIFGLPLYWRIFNVITSSILKK